MSDILDNILDASLEELADLPEFKPFAPGVHEVSIELTPKTIGTHPSVELMMTMVKTIEMADPAQEVPAPGATASVAFMLDIDIGQGKFKEMLKPIAEHLGITISEKGAIRTVIEKSKGMICKVVTNVRAGKEEGQVFMNVKSLAVA